jgi:pimeloyl-ACP methyl ester carboxylesterase
MNYVFVHGEPSNAASFEPCLSELGLNGSILLFEAPDHGASEDSPSLTVSAWADALAAYVVALDGPSVLIGHSLGAWAVAHVLPTLGARVTRAVLLSGFTHFPAETFAPYEALAAGLDAGAVSLDALVDIGAQAWLSSHSDPALKLTLLRQMLAREPMTRIARGLRRLREVESPAVIPTPYDTPTVCLHALGDRATPVDGGRALAALGSRSRFIEVEDDGHFVHWDHPHLVRKAILD